MAYYCWKCGNELVFEVKVGIKVGRQDVCPHCKADLHVCKNCAFYDPSLHNQCREAYAEFIRDREVANFCPSFTFREGPPPSKTEDPEEAKAKLEALFKGLD